MNFENLKWVHPFEGRVNLIEMLYALYSKVGLANFDRSDFLEKYSISIPDSKKYIFVVADGMGYNLLKRILPGSFLMQNINSILNTIYPTSTGTVLTSIVTGKTPDKHGINGWYSYDKKFDESFMTIPFVDRFEPNKPLKVNFEDVFFEKSVIENIPITCNVVVKDAFINSSFSKWISGGKDILGYTDTRHAFEIIKKILKDERSSYTYVYFGDFDKICHTYGTKSREAKNFLEEFDQCVKDFYEFSKDMCTTIITADHGLIDIEQKNYNVMLPDDTMCEYFYAPPGGEARFTSFYVKELFVKEFKQEFTRKYGMSAVLLSIDEADELRLFGSNEIGEIARMRFGNYVAIWKDGYAFTYYKTQIGDSQLNIGVHGGLTKDEMEVPLIIL